MKVIQSPLFEKKVKKFKKNQKQELDEQIHKIIENPESGEAKKGDLQGVFVSKFKIHSVRYLLSYRFSSEKLELISIGSHENYYRDLKRYLKNR